MAGLINTVGKGVRTVYANTIEEYNSYVDLYGCNNKIIWTKSNNISQESARKRPCSGSIKRQGNLEYHYLGFEDETEKKVIHLRVVYNQANIAQKEKTNEDLAGIKAVNYFGGEKGLLSVVPEDDEEPEVKDFFCCPDYAPCEPYSYINEKWIGHIWNNVCSLDRNKSYLASMLEVYPATKPWIDKWEKEYNEAVANGDTVTKDRLKLRVNCFIGMLKHKNRNNARRRIIDNQNRKIHELRLAIEKAGCTVLLANTDAIKFIDRGFEYTESTAIGGFKYEFKHTKAAILGLKNYAYIKADGTTRIIKAGPCKAFDYKPKEEWTLEEFLKIDPINLEEVEVVKLDKTDGKLYKYIRRIDGTYEKL